MFDIILLIENNVVSLQHKTKNKMALNIKKAIFDRGLEVREVATRMGITNVTISRHINGNPSVEILNRIANAIGCDVTDLFDTHQTIDNNENIIVCPKCGTRLKVTKE